MSYRISPHLAWGRRSISTIINTHKHLTRRIIVQQYSKPQAATNKNVPGALNFSNSSPQLQATGASSLRRTTGSTLGFEAIDNTVITNPIKSENGDVLKVKISQRAAQVCLPRYLLVFSEPCTNFISRNLTRSTNKTKSQTRYFELRSKVVDVTGTSISLV